MSIPSSQGSERSAAGPLDLPRPAGELEDTLYPSEDDEGVHGGASAPDQRWGAPVAMLVVVGLLLAGSVLGLVR